MNIEMYFDTEYNYLHHAGIEFAEKFPKRGRQLRLSDMDLKDPFVERLLEGVSFLAARIHERLDNDFPELAGGLLEQLFPQMLRPFPACSILSAKHRPGAITQPVTIEKGGEVRSELGEFTYRAPGGQQDRFQTIEVREKTEFIFRTTNELTIRPMEIKGVNITDNDRALVIKIQPDRNVSYDALQLDSLSFYLNGPDSLRYTLLLYLLRYHKALRVRELDRPNAEFRKIKNYRIGISGVSDNLKSAAKDTSLIPYDRQTFSCYRLLHEYFSFPQRFFFVEIEGLEQFEASNDGHAFEIKIDFEKSLSRNLHPGRQNILLHCTPIINLFESSAELSLDQRMPEYYIVPDNMRRKSREIYSVNSVTGIKDRGVDLFLYTPVTSMKILDTTDPDYDYKRFYSIIRRPKHNDMADAYIRLFGVSLENENFEKETLSMDVTLSNGYLPSSSLDVGSIKKPEKFPPGIEASNLAVPTEMLECPQPKNYIWNLIAHLTLSYSTLTDKQTLAKILTLYNWSPSAQDPNKKKIEAITKVHPLKEKSIVHKGSLLRGVEFHLEIDPTGFSYGEGDIYLFGTVLSRFLSEYATINTFVFLKITETGTDKEYLWKPTPGQISPI
jgi:type VI secretion system protein ImpG